MVSWLTLALFIVLVLGGGTLIGVTARPDGWYARLNKPSFNPPNRVFAPVWTVLYILIAIAGWHTFERAPAGAAMAVWGAQLVLNFAWSPVFFRARRPDAALAIVAALLALIVAFIALTWSADPLAAWLFVPYAAWTAFAAVLNAALLRLNPVRA